METEEFVYSPLWSLVDPTDKGFDYWIAEARRIKASNNPDSCRINVRIQLKLVEYQMCSEGDFVHALTQSPRYRINRLLDLLGL